MAILRRVLPALSIFAATVSAISSDPVANGTVVTLNDITYYVAGISVGQISGVQDSSLSSATIDGLDIVPMTIIETEEPLFDATEFSSTIANYTSSDDVFQSEFLKAVYVKYTGSANSHFDISQSNVTSLFMVSEATTCANGTVTASISTSLPKGPYFVSAKSGKIFQAYRVYADDYLAFTEGAVTDGSDGFLPLPAVTSNVMAKSIAVPSRLYYTATAEKPLAGLRLGVKDIYHVKGVRTSGGNRAHYYLYGPQNVTAPSVQRLIDQGAVFVGKMGTVQFANGDSPTADWVDLHCPFNPRGDGYQGPSGSSAGPGAGMGAYEWLDIAVGSDSGGSMRGPAAAQGVFGNRPSTGAISMDHVIPLSVQLDTAGVFAKSGALWAKVVESWYQGFSSNYTSYPKTIYRSTSTSGWWSGNISDAATNMIDDFVTKLEGFLGVNTTISANVTDNWAQTHDSTAPSLDDLMHYVYGTLITHDQWNLFGKILFSDYEAANDGRRPFINPGPLVRWQWGQTHTTNASYAEAVQNMTTFRTWWETGYGKSDPESCSEGLYIYPFSVGLTAYRNVYLKAPTGPPLGFGESDHTEMAGVPEVVVPIGEVPYNSTVTYTTEYLPVTMAIRAARGCDMMLTGLVRDLESSGILKPVSAGSRLYPS